MKVESESEQLRQHEQHLVTRSAAASCTAWVAKSECCQSGKMRENNFDNTSCERSHVARCSRAVRVTISEYCQSGKSKEQRAKMKVESESEQLRQHEQHLVTRSAAASCTAWVAKSECCQSAKSEYYFERIENKITYDYGKSIN